MLEFLPEFILGFLVCFRTNLFIAVCALGIGLLLGAMVAYLLSRGGVFVKAVGLPVISLLRAFPVFVLMFVLWNFIPRTQGLAASGFLSDANLILIFALSAYSVSALSDVISDALSFRKADDHDRVWLVVPNIFRIFVVLVMSTSIGAAIGVKEAVTYTLIFSDGLADRSQKIMLLLIATVFFAVFFAAAKLILDQLTHRIKRGQAA
jgi:ABC-type amino acid transport system permease subunit